MLGNQSLKMSFMVDAYFLIHRLLCDINFFLKRIYWREVNKWQEIDWKSLTKYGGEEISSVWMISNKHWRASLCKGKCLWISKRDQNAKMLTSPEHFWMMFKQQSSRIGKWLCLMISSRKTDINQFKKR
jgi:hypothetical protein